LRPTVSRSGRSERQKRRQKSEVRNGKQLHIAAIVNPIEYLSVISSVILSTLPLVSNTSFPSCWLSFRLYLPRLRMKDDMFFVFFCHACLVVGAVVTFSIIIS
jgi:hypothetical protein